MDFYSKPVKLFEKTNKKLNFPFSLTTELILFYNISWSAKKSQKQPFSVHPLSSAWTVLIFAPVDESELLQNEWPKEKNMVFRGRNVIKGKQD